MSLKRKKAGPAGKIAARSAGAKTAALKSRVMATVSDLFRSGLASEDALARFANRTRKLLGLDGLLLWYQVMESEFRLFASSPSGQCWLEHMPPEQAGLGALVERPGGKLARGPGELAGCRPFYEKIGLGPRTASAFSIGDSKQLLVVELLPGQKPIPAQAAGLVKDAASGLALVADNARLERVNKKETEENRVILEMSRILNSTLNPKVVRIRAMGAVVRLLDCEAGSLYLIDEAKGELYFEVALGRRADQVKEIRLKMGEGVAGWVAQTGEPVLVKDVSKDARWASKADEKSKWQTRNMVTVPVKAGGKIIGVLQALNKSGNAVFDEHDLGLMESLADHVAIALENALLHDEQRRTFFQTAEALADAIEKRDPYTGGHTRRVHDFSGAIGIELNLDKDSLEMLDLAAILHDIGKIGVEDRVLRKPGKLTDEEFALMCQHPEHGFSILSHIKSLEKVIPGMRHHHERLDGRGYPMGLKEKQIPLVARIISVADTWDAMTSDRPYRPALAEEAALKELWQSRARQLDPEIVLAFFKAYKNKRIYTQHREQRADLPGPALELLTSIANENKLEL